MSTSSPSLNNFKKNDIVAVRKNCLFYPYIREWEGVVININKKTSRCMVQFLCSNEEFDQRRIARIYRQARRMSHGNTTFTVIFRASELCDKTNQDRAWGKFMMMVEKAKDPIYKTSENVKVLSFGASLDKVAKWLKSKK